MWHITAEQVELIGEPIKDSILVDGSWITDTGVVECQGVRTGTKENLLWLNENEYDNEILKCKTKAWGENPKDFGRK
jgi:hypothetical protein